MIPFAAAVTAAHADPVAASTNECDRPVVHRAVPEDVARRVDVSEGVAVERDAEPLGRKAPAPVVAESGHRHVLGTRHVGGARARRRRPLHVFRYGNLPCARHAPAVAHRPRRRHPDVVGDVVQSAEFVVVAPPCPVRQRVEVCEHLVLRGHRSPCRHRSIDSSGNAVRGTAGTVSWPSPLARPGPLTGMTLDHDHVRTSAASRSVLGGGNVAVGRAAIHRPGRLVTCRS